MYRSRYADFSRENRMKPMRQSERKNEQIFEAAVNEFLERGFLGASMDRISERANVSKRTVYNHFESKEALFSSIAQHLADKVIHHAHISYNPAVPIRDELTRLGWAQGGMNLDPNIMKMVKMVLGEALRDPDFVCLMRPKISIERVVAGFLEAATKDGKLNITDFEGVAEQFCSLIKGRSFFPQMFGAKPTTHKDMERFIKDAVDFVLKCYGTETALQEEATAA